MGFAPNRPAVRGADNPYRRLPVGVFLFPRVGRWRGAETMSEEKFIGYFRLIDACEKPGCPLCRCVASESRSYLDALLYEQVTDPDTRRAIRAAWGFCNWHTWMLLEIEHSLFGASIIYEDLVNLALRRTERLGDPARRRGRGGWLAALMRRPRWPMIQELYRKRALCPACTSAADTETRYLETLVRFVDDGDLQAAYARSDGLCLPHLFAALEENAERPEARTLVERTREKWAKVGRDIGSFVCKHDYRNREPYTAEETASYRRAFEMLVGARSVFGNDVHTRRSARAARPRAAAPPVDAPPADGSGMPRRAARERAS
jgi:hypothetical protein